MILNDGINMTKDDMICSNCNCEHSRRKGQWWHLGNYFGLYGLFCPDCYDLVSHDAYKNPKHPIEFSEILDKQLKSGGTTNAKKLL